MTCCMKYYSATSLSDGGELSKMKVSFFSLIYSILHYKLQKWYWCIKNPIWHLFFIKKTANTRALNLLISRFNLASVTP